MKPALQELLDALKSGWGIASAWVGNFWSGFSPYLPRFALPCVVIAVAAILGILVAEYFVHEIPLWIWIFTSLLSLASAWRWSGSGTRKGDSLIWLAAFCIFGMHYRISEQDALRSFLLKNGPLAASIKVSGVIDTGVERDPHTDHGWKFGLKVETVNGHPWRAARLFVQYRSQIPPNYGDRIEASGSARASPIVRNPGEFDFANYLRHEGYAGEFRIAHPESLYVLEKGVGSRIYAAALRSREWLGEEVTRGIEDDPTIASTIRAMVLGTQETTPEEVEEAFVNSGTMHVFAVSGLHVVLFGWVLRTFLKPFRLPPIVLLSLIIPLMFFFVFITGLRSSAWRAAIMASIMLSAPSLKRRSDLYNGLGTAALLLMAWDPHEVFHAGFQLSFGVLFSLAVLTQYFMKPLRPYFEPDPFLPRQLLTSAQEMGCYVRRKMAECLAVSVASTLGCAPLMIAHFGLITPIGIVANLFLVFLSMAILFTACVSLLTACCSLKWLTVLANHTNYALALTSVWLATFFSSIPYGHFFLNKQLWELKETGRLCVLDLPSGGSASSWQERHAASPWLFDAGSASSWSRTVRPHLLRNQIRELDGLFLSHRDITHNGAASSVRSYLRPQKVYTGPRETPNTRLVPTDIQVYQGYRSNLSQTTSIEVLYPHYSTPFGLADDRCSIFLLHHDGWKILFQFDTGFVAEKWLIEHYPGLRADILIKGSCAHDYSGIAEFLNLVAPRAIIATNAEFPLEERIPDDWKAMVQSKGIPLFDQLHSGAVSLRFHQDVVQLQGFINKQELILRKDESP